jgi:mono/diheme cytochrome c family protein
MRALMSALALQILVLAFTDPARSDETRGQSILKDRCGRCHAVTPQSESLIGLAPNLWEKLRSYPSERLAFELAEGMGSRHPAMPQIQFSSEEIAEVQSYLSGGQGD